MDRAVVTERYVTSNDGLRLFLRDYEGPRTGGKTPLLCLPGLTRNSKDFRGVAEMFAHERRVICPDIRGRGFSDDDPTWQNYHPATYIADTRDVLCALGVHKIVVIGTSMGGIMAMAMAAAMPTMLHGMVINDVGPRVDRVGLGAILRYMDTSPAFDAWEDAGRHLKRAFSDQVPMMDDAAWTRAAHSSYKQLQSGKIVFDWDPNIVSALKNDKTEVYDLWYLFDAACRFPMLTVRGEKSEILSAALVTEMLSRNPEMQAVEVPGFGHAPFLTEESSSKSIQAFFEKFNL